MSRWEVLSSRPLVDLPWFKLRMERIKTGRGVVLEEYPVIEGRDWACIVPVTKTGDVVLVQQYRHGVQRETLEFPAGGVDPGEEPLAAAERELLEETGYAADHWQPLRQISPETTRHTTQAHVYLATGAHPIAEQRLEPAEDVRVVTRPLSDPGLVDELDHAVHVMALLLAYRATADA